MEFVKHIKDGFALSWQLIAMPVRHLSLSAGIALLVLPWLFIFVSVVGCPVATALRCAYACSWNHWLPEGKEYVQMAALAMVFLVFVPATRQIFNVLDGHLLSWSSWRRSFSLTWLSAAGMLLCWAFTRALLSGVFAAPFSFLFIVASGMALALLSTFVHKIALAAIAFLMIIAAWLAPLWFPTIVFFTLIYGFFSVVLWWTGVLILRTGIDLWRSQTMAGMLLLRNFIVGLVYFVDIGAFFAVLGAIVVAVSFAWQLLAGIWFLGMIPVAEILAGFVALYAALVLLMMAPLFVYRLMPHAQGKPDAVAVN